jgi:hypothetical protein
MDEASLSTDPRFITPIMPTSTTNAIRTADVPRSFARTFNRMATPSVREDPDRRGRDDPIGDSV